MSLYPIGYIIHVFLVFYTFTGIISILRTEIKVSLQFTCPNAVDERSVIQIPNCLDHLSRIRSIDHRIHKRLCMVSIAALAFHDRRPMMTDAIDRLTDLLRLIRHNEQRHLLKAAVEQVNHLR